MESRGIIYPKKMLDGFTFNRIIGSGGNSDVCLYEQGLQTVAIKFDIKNALLAESYLLKEIYERNGTIFPKYIKHGTVRIMDSTHFYLAMEYLPYSI